MSEAALKLTVYFGERDRAGGRFLSDSLVDIYARHGLSTSLVMRGVEGFGIKHHLRTDRLLTLSEDLPLVAVAVDTEERIARALEDVNRLDFDGLVTLERARMLTASTGAVSVPVGLDRQSKLTVYLGRHERVAGGAAYEAVVELLRQRGIAGASVLLGVDGTAHGARERARFFGANTRVPLMIVAIGDGPRLAESLAGLGALLERPLLTLERVTVCKRDGRLLGPPDALPDTDPAGRGVWQKLMVYAGEQSRSEGQPLHHQLVRALRAAGAAGVTSIRGIWGYHGEHPPHGDSFWQLRRRVPMVTVIVDTPARSRRWFELVDELTAQSGLVTSEMVPAFRAISSSGSHGGLQLARLRRGGGA